jgi:hypothetical protein
MKFSHLALASGLILAAAGAFAQSAPAAKPAAKASAKKAVAAPVAAKPIELAEAGPEQLAAFDRAYLGEYACEFKQTVHLTPTEGKPGYVDVAWKQQRFTMKPVLSPTGALRLEDVAGRTLMIQIANKSMLLDTKIGQRLVDDCMHAAQIKAVAEAKAAAEANPEGAARNALGIVKQ